MSENKKPRILILCTGNSCRSQMAEGFFRHYLKDEAEVKSAGTEAHGLNPTAVKVMREAGIDISTQKSKKIDDLGDPSFDFILTVCDNANENCPYFPGNAQRFHYDFPDPAKTKGDEKEVLHVFRRVRDMIDNYVQDFITDNLPGN